MNETKKEAAIDMRPSLRFRMMRVVDETGVSGHGHIADGVVFPDGLTVVRWKTATPGTTIFESLESAKKVHGHDGKTQFIFSDEHYPKVDGEALKEVWMCSLCHSDMDIPINHCFQCGAGGGAVPMMPWQLAEIHRFDKYRSDEIAKRQAELTALRGIAYDVFGAVALGVVVTKYENDELLSDEEKARGREPMWRAGGISGISRRGSNTRYLVSPKPDETEEQYAARAVESIEFDPIELRRLHKKRRVEREERERL